ncbi:MAG: alkyl sulfatase dimerization domain-containing protein, partial [Pseudomonadota bacterium]
IALAGGPEAVFAEVQKAREAGEFQWALQLVDRLLCAGHNVEEAQRMKAALLREHAVDQINCPTRHYYLQCAKEIEEGLA